MDEKLARFVRKLTKFKDNFLTILPILDYYAANATNVSIIEVSLMLLDTLLEIGIVTPADLVATKRNTFSIIRKSIEAFPGQQEQMRLQSIASIVTLLLSKNSHMVEQRPNSTEAKALLTLKKQYSEDNNLVITAALLR